MKKHYIYGSVVAIILSFAGYQAGHYQAKAEIGASQKVAYIDGKAEKTKALANKEKTPDEISDEEGIHAEQIVVKITDKGYVTSHGDHFHFFNGKVPYDAIISEELIMKDPHYVFKSSDVINEVRDGYIIKVDGAYYLYLKPGSKKVNIRTKAQIEAEQKKWGGHSRALSGQASASQLASAAAQGRYTTDDGYVFSPTDIIDDFGDAFLVPHGDHFHYIPKKDLSPAELQAAQAYWDQKQGKSSGNSSVSYGVPSNSWTGYDAPRHQVSPLSQPSHSAGNWRELLRQLYTLPRNQRHVEPDGLVFDPAQITRRVPQGVVVPHGNHYHMIPYSQMSPLEQEIVRSIPIGANVSGFHEPERVNPPQQKPQPQPIAHQPQPAQPSPKPIVSEEHHGGKHVTYFTPIAERPGKPNSKIIYSPEEVVAAKAAGKYATSDGYIFDAKDIKEDLGEAYIIPHMTHEHWVPKEDLSPAERKAAEEFLAGKSTEKTVDKPVEKPVEKPAESAEPTNPLANLSAKELYERVAPAKIVPVEKMSYNAAYAVKVSDDYIIIPHTDHYHNLKFSWFDEKLYTAPDGYTLEQFFATIKYYIAHPDELPAKDGWGHSSDYEHGSNASDPETNNFSPSEEPADKEDGADEDNTEEGAKVTGPEMDALEERLWASLKVAEEMADATVKEKISDAVDALFDRQNDLKVGGEDSIAKINADLDTLCKQYNFKA